MPSLLYQIKIYRNWYPSCNKSQEASISVRFSVNNFLFFLIINCFSTKLINLLFYISIIVTWTVFSTYEMILFSAIISKFQDVFFIMFLIDCCFSCFLFCFWLCRFPNLYICHTLKMFLFSKDALRNLLIRL